MKEISIFIDESGVFGNTSYSPAKVLHHYCKKTSYHGGENISYRGKNLLLELLHLLFTPLQASLPNEMLPPNLLGTAFPAFLFYVSH